MKKYYLLIIVALIFGLVLTGCSVLSNVGQVPTTEQSGVSYLTKHTADDPQKTTLFAGQTLDVGDVLVWNDGDTLYVQYVITDPDWCLTETHLQIATTLAGIPQNKKGNPIPGHFEENDEHGCVPEVLYTYDLTEKGWSVDQELFIAAHAVVSTQPVGERETILYGSQRMAPDNGLYRIDLEAGTATRLFDTGETDKNSPNALGYDPANMRLYYMKYSTNGPSVLYFYDLAGGKEYAAGLILGQVVVGASFYDGAYYYIPDDTADLYKVTLNADGYVTNYELVCGDFNGKPVTYRFGDFAIDEYGMLYASTGSTAEFFELDVGMCDYRFITDSVDDALGVQVSFGSDGTLYGHAAGTGEFFEIDLTNGTKSSIGYVAGEVNDPELFSDLASGEFFVPITETAWGDGDRFVEQGNWATYFTYKVQGWHRVETLTVDAADIDGEDSIEVLESGKSYKFEVIGTWEDTSQSDHFNDAEYVTFNSWVTYMQGTPNWGPNQKDLQVNEDFVDWGTYDSFHEYTLMFTGEGLKVNFRIFDGKADVLPLTIEPTWYGDNEGELTVEIYEWN